ncbi:MAG: CHASE2 domain-containing protein [Leptolyngbyaceae cyanobacterium]
MFPVGTRLHHDRYTILKPLGQGGFSQTFEVDDGGTVKVLKVLLEDYPLAVKLFQREFKVLSQMDHPGIPQVEDDGYFMLAASDPTQATHCLVMERIPGLDLRQWLYKRHNEPLEEETALDWLAQLAEILTQLHQQQCFHRDIKPSNIMLRPNGQLALIDFGAVREITETYLEKQADDITRTNLYSRGYTPMEQIQGRAVPESDFFALGRTFVHLLTGSNPSTFLAERGVLLWQSCAPHISVALAHLIDQLMAPFPDDRPQSPEAIATLIAAVRSQIAQGLTQRVGDQSASPQPCPPSQQPAIAENVTPLDVATCPPDDKDDLTQPWKLQAQYPFLEKSPQPEFLADGPIGIEDWTPVTDLPPSVLPPSVLSPPAAPTSESPNGKSNAAKRLMPWWQRRWQLWGQAMASSVVVTASVMGLRLLGLLQSSELQAFDQLMQWRSPEPPDDRIVLVTIDSNDIAYQNAQGWVRQGSLADEALAQLLDKLDQYNPRLVGLDIYRPSSDLGIDPSRDVSFREALSQYDNLIAVCAVGGGDQSHPAIDPPLEVPLERIGFSNIPYDVDGQVRRHLLGMTPDATCNTSQSLSSQLVFRYLDDIRADTDDRGTLRINDEGIDIGLEDGILVIGGRSYPAVNRRRIGGYQHPDSINDGGYQILLNYRSRPSLSTQIPLSQFLTSGHDNILANLISDRIVLIGTIDRSYGDYHATPYGTLPGVMIQAHMVSQMLSAVLDDRPLLWGLPPWADGLWVFGWSALASIVVIVGRSPWHYGGGMIALVLGLTGISFLFLLQGGWVPLVPAAISLLLTLGAMIWLSQKHA